MELLKKALPYISDALMAFSFVAWVVWHLAFLA